MNRDESTQIEIVRLICITSMMWVHVAPGLSTPSFVSEGPGSVFGAFFGDTLGRVSVTTLSFVSGYLFRTTGIFRPVRDVLRRLAFSILLPMLVWSAIFILLAFAKGRVTGIPPNSLAAIGDGWLAAINAWTGLAGRTANQSLFFVRDLIAATILLRLAAPLVRRLPLTSIVLAIALTFVPQTEPILYRAPILTFMVLGAVSAQKGWTIARLARPSFSLVFGFGFSILATGIALTLSGDAFPVDTIHDLLRRAGIGCLILAVAYALIDHPGVRRLSALGRHTYLAYLSHVSLIGLVWVPWTRFVGTEAEPIYLLFFLAMPPLCMALAALAGRAVDHLPPVVQIVLRGRIHRGPPLARQTPA